ncbi:MAG TPA: DUF3821 domain-containing protein [Methanoregula sp.]|nr:DUF3821 domain-containing protein [Methanoregula sp.]
MQFPEKIPAILAVLLIFFLCSPPVAGNLNRIAGTAPVFIGESNLDISAGLNGCHTIAWWPNGTDINSQDPGKNISIIPINTASSVIFHYNLDPDVFTGYTGTWYCQDKQPYIPVFILYEPQISLRIWDLDTDQDVSGQSVPFATNITYRIDTNMVPALSFASRPNANPSDSFYTVTMTDPKGSPVPLLATGSVGNQSTVFLHFDSSPFITASPYFGKNMQSWSHSARDKQGYVLYPQGTYTISVQANLNGMQDAYAKSSQAASASGKITAANSVTLVMPVTVTTTATPPPTATQAQAAGTSGPATLPPTVVPVAKKTTYSPVPAAISLSGIAAAGMLVLLRRR